MIKEYFLMVILFLLIVTMSFPQEQKKIIEEVSVSWWQVPVFAIDKDGNPVTDLKKEDVEVYLDGGKMPGFSLNKRNYTVTEKKYEPVEAPTAEQVPFIKKKVVLLLFDLTLSGELSSHRAKKVAEKIVKESDDETRFFVLTIEAYSGLVFLGEGSGKNKDELINLINTKVNEKKNRRKPNFTEMIGEELMIAKGAVPGRWSKYEAEDYPLFIESVSKPYKRTSMGFLYAFETLYFLLNSIEDNKFIYLFSEGLSKSILTSNRSLAGERGMYDFYIKRIGKYMNRCGAVFFVINTMGVDQYMSTETTGYMRGGGQMPSSQSAISGEEMLHMLTKNSSGTYMEGTGQDIVEKLHKIGRAYYEVSFPDPPQLEGLKRKVNIVSKRKGVKIISLKHLEKRKHYTQLNSVEKDMLALNLVTQPPSTIIKSKIEPFNAQIEKTKKNKKHITYNVTLPSSISSKEIDLYKIWLRIDDQDTAQVEKIEKEKIHTGKKNLKIEFSLSPAKDKKDKNEKKAPEPGELKTYFVIVNSRLNPARAYVHGIELYDDDPELLKMEEKEISRQRKSGEAYSPQEMQTILRGAADYCERLKRSAFHFYCREKILETRIPLTGAENQIPEVKISDMKRGVVRTMDEMRNKAYTQVKGYLFGYRLIKKGDSVKESRDFIASRDEVPVSRDQVLKSTAFFSEKAIFAPITLLDNSRQDRYNYRFVRFHHYGDHQVVVIEAVPKNTQETLTLYGQVWIDRNDFSVIKIEANPKSIKNYSHLEKIAKKLRTRLHLSLELEFDYIHDGIRFPTKVSMLEKYKGGRIIRKFRGSQGWERIRAQFSYSDYQFFSIKTDVEIQN